jgi:hypothetical protein
MSKPLNEARGYLLDTSALAALPASHEMSLLVSAGPRFDWALYAPVTCVEAADRVRPGIARHIGRIPAVELLDLTYEDVVDIRERAPKLPLDVAHVLSLAQPTANWPAGLIVTTVLPDLYKGFDVRIYPVGN